MIRVEALGGLRVFKDGEELTSLPAKPLRAALLVHLAVEREATRQRLCFLLWPDSSPERARRSLSQTLYELRKDLGSDWVATPGESLAATDGLSVDVAEMRTALAEGRDRDAVAVYGGPFLDGVSLGGGSEFEHWSEAKRSELHGEARRAFQAAVEHEADPEERARLSRAWMQMDPLDDEAQHALIESLALAGDRAGALEQFRLYSELIERELQVEPLDHTVELIEKIKAGTVGRTASENPDPSQPIERPVEADSPGSDSDPVDPGAGLVFSRLIGRGATGSVYLAREPALKRLVAVKVLDAKMAANPRARARFEREAQSAASITHPNVAAVHSVGTTADGRPYLVMPYVKGGTLADRMKALGPLPPEEVRRLLAEGASALAAAHAVGVIHRDVRPANFLYEEATGRTYLADFGVAGVLESGTDEIAQLTRTGELLGNVEYISPEQAHGEELTDRSDVYSLGILGKALLSGGRAGADGMDDRSDPQLREILERATSKQPRHRPSAAELADALTGRRDRPPRSGRGILERIMSWWRG